MPAEAERLRHRIRGRDRWFFGLISVGVVTATVLALMLTRASEPRRGTTCVTITRPGFTGAATYRACDGRAPALCRQFAAENVAFAADCRRKGFLPG